MADKFSILVLGACNSGKSSLINSITGKIDCKIGHDGKPTTLKLQLAEFEDVVFIDTPGLPKSPAKIFSLKFSDNFEPDMIWLVLNFQSSIENDEFDIINTCADIPVVVILNKVDFYKGEDLGHFDTNTFFMKRKHLASIYKRLNEEKTTHSNIRHIVLTSVKDEDDSDREPVGIDRLQEIIKECIQQQIANDESIVSIAIIGYSSSGKSSMINAISSNNKLATVGSNGALTTKEWTCYQAGQLKLWDCPAINKRSTVHDEYATFFRLKVKPDMIWFILNAHNADIDDEHELLNILKIDTKIPVIVVINQVDTLRQMTTLTEDDLVEFSKRKQLEKLSKRKKLLEVQENIYKTWPEFMELKAVTMTSLVDDEECGMPLGVNALVRITQNCLKNEKQRHILNILEPKNKWKKSGQQLENSSDMDLVDFWTDVNQKPVSARQNRMLTVIAVFFASIGAYLSYARADFSGIYSWFEKFKPTPKN